MEITEFKTFLKDLRTKNKYTFTTLSRLSGVSQPYLSQLESGKRKPSPEILKKLSEPLGVPLFELMVAAGYTDERTELEELTLKIDHLKQLAKLNAVYKAELERRLKSNNDPMIEEEVLQKLSSIEHKGTELKMNIEALTDRVAKRRIIEEEYTEIIAGVKKTMDDVEKSGGWRKAELGEVFKNTITFEVPRFDSITLEDNEKHTEFISEEEAKQRFLYLENLLTMDENIYLNKKILSKYEKEKALQILKLVFEEKTNNKE